MIRQIKNKMMYGAPYPNYQPMRVYSSIWNADDWATQGGRVKTDWSQAPFTAYFRNFKATSCSPNNCGQSSPSANGLFNQELNQAEEQQLKDMDTKYNVYDYCEDPKRRIGTPEECRSQ